MAFPDIDTPMESLLSMIYRSWDAIVVAEHYDC